MTVKDRIALNISYSSWAKSRNESETKTHINKHIIWNILSAFQNRTKKKINIWKNIRPVGKKVMRNKTSFIKSTRDDSKKGISAEKKRTEKKSRRFIETTIITMYEHIFNAII